MAAIEREKPKPAVDPSPKSVPAEGVTTAEGATFAPAPVRDPLMAGQPTDNIPDPKGLEGASVALGQKPAPFSVVDYTVPDLEAPELVALKQDGAKAGDVRPAFVVRVHPDGALDLAVGADGATHPLQRVLQSDAVAGAERSRGKWSKRA